MNLRRASGNSVLSTPSTALTDSAMSLRSPRTYAGSVLLSDPVSFVTTDYVVSVFMKQSNFEKAIKGPPRAKSGRFRDGLGLQECSTSPERIIFDHVCGGAPSICHSREGANPFHDKWGVV